MLIDDGEIDPIVSHYLRGDSEVDNYKSWQEPVIKKGGFELLEIGIRRRGGEYSDVMRMDQELEVIIRYRLTQTIDCFWITMHMKNEQGNKMFSFSGGGRCYETHHESGEYVQTCIIPASVLNCGNYAIDVMAFRRVGNIECLADEKDLISFTIVNRQISIGGYMGKEPGDITPRFEFFERKI